MKKINVIFALLSMLISFPVFASTTTPLLSNDEYRIGQGDIETTLSIDPTFIRGTAGDDEIFDMKLGGNYFYTNIIAPGLEVDLSAGAGTLVRILPNVKLYYPTDTKILPYLQVGFGYEHAVGNDFAAFAIGPGVNYMLSNSVALGAQIRYDLGAGSETLHVIQIPIQFAIYFKY